MKKFLTALFNVVVYLMLAWSILCAVYTALPAEYQSMLPWMNWLTALISGGSTLLLGSGGVAVQSFLAKAKTASNEKYALLTGKFLTLTDNYAALEEKYTAIENKYNEVVSSIGENNKLLKIDLKAKLSNPLIDATVKNLIEGALNGSDNEEG